MKLVTFQYGDRPRAGLWKEDGVIDLSVRDDIPANILEILQHWQQLRPRLQSIDETETTRLTVDHTDLRQPILRPPKILAIALNYAAHVAESATVKPAVQMWFNKQSTCANGPYSPVALPVVSDKLDYEGELGVVIGRRCRHVPASRAKEVIAGYTVVNDLSVRDWQRAAQTFQIGKSFDTHGPFGPCLVTADEIDDPQQLNLRTLVNGEIRQDSNTRNMLYPIAEQIEHLTKAFTLEPGDLLVTGTPAGVGASMKPPRFLKVGDVVRVEIEGIGAIENPIVAESGETRIE